MKTSDIIPLSEYRKNLSSLMSRVNTTDEPVVVTTNGKPEAVIVSPRLYDQLVADAELVKSANIVRQSIKAFDEGKGIPFDKAMKELRKRLHSERITCDTPSKSRPPRSAKSKTPTATSSTKTRR